MSTLLDTLETHQANRLQNKRDGRTFGLVLPGGGMRAVYSAGAVTTLLKYDLTEAFDHIVGVSAGALHGAYFLADDTETMSKTYPEDLTNKNFVNLLRREKRVDIDYLVDTVLKHKHPLSMERLAQAKTKLHVVMTDAKTGKKVVLSDHAAFAEIYEEFRATAALPLLYDKTVPVGGRYYIDGGVADNLPIDVAVKLGCTDIVVLMTQQIAAYHFDKRHQRLVKRLVKHLAKNQTPQVRMKLPTDERMLQVNLRRITHPTKKIRFYVLEPSDEEYLVSIGSIDKPKIERLGKLGVTDMDHLLHNLIAH
jgi:predicted patatin/cPLA2 family phospholipase